VASFLINELETQLRPFFQNLLVILCAHVMYDLLLFPPFPPLLDQVLHFGSVDCDKLTTHRNCLNHHKAEISLFCHFLTFKTHVCISIRASLNRFLSNISCAGGCGDVFFHGPVLLICCSHQLRR